jgi:hypothetical protein
MSAAHYDDSYIYFWWFVICSIMVSGVFHMDVVFTCSKLYSVVHNRDVKRLLYIFLGVLLIYMPRFRGVV